MITASQVQGEVYKLLKNSSFAKEINGKVYRQGMRPKNSIKEDAVVIFTSGLNGDVHSGIVTINVFVADIDCGNGIFEIDGQRVAEVEQLLAQWTDELQGLNSNYLWRLQQTIFNLADEEINQHFIICKLAYRYYDGK